jgi:hypothetical protein
MLDDPNLERARRWRLKAEECRTVADQLKNRMAQASIRRLAETYDRLADRCERRVTVAETPKKPEAG